jgi:hypothetical protein
MRSTYGAESVFYMLRLPAYYNTSDRVDKNDLELLLSKLQETKPGAEIHKGKIEVIT